ncbi:MAG: DUF4234 domain-containing protein [Gammaproteobacteria bacterium]|nr:DUF4234 domain-containing protein [Gammaproteobacteria bacterium]
MASSGEINAAAAEAEVQVPWYPPLPIWKLLLLLVLTLGIYSAFFLYRLARELRDHEDPYLTPPLYPFSLLLAPAAGIATGVLARKLKDSTPPEQRARGFNPVSIGLLVFLGLTALGVSEWVPSVFFYFAAIALFVTPWLLLQHQLNLRKAHLADTAFKTRPNRYTKLQLTALAAGSVVVVLIGFALYEGVLRMTGEELPVDTAYVDPAGRFSVQAPRDGWTLVEPGYIGDDSDMDLLGPGSSDWAVVYVHQQAGWTIDDLVESRFQILGDAFDQYYEERRLLPDSEIAISHAIYSGRTAIDGQTEYAVSTFATRDLAVEIIVFTAGRTMNLSRGAELAQSIRPVIQ